MDFKGGFEIKGSRNTVIFGMLDRRGHLGHLPVHPNRPQYSGGFKIDGSNNNISLEAINGQFPLLGDGGAPGGGGPGGGPGGPGGGGPFGPGGGRPGQGPRGPGGGPRAPGGPGGGPGGSNGGVHARTGTIADVIGLFPLPVGMAPGDVINRIPNDIIPDADASDAGDEDGWIRVPSPGSEPNSERAPAPRFNARGEEYGVPNAHGWIPVLPPGDEPNSEPASPSKRQRLHLHYTE